MAQNITKKEKIFQMIRYLLLLILSALTLAPLFLLVLNSFKSKAEIVSNPIGLPAKWDMQYLVNAVQQIHYFRALLVTIALTVVSIGILIVVSSVTAWVMVRNKSKISKILFLSFILSMLIPFQALMYPLLHQFDLFGLKNYSGLTLMYVGFGLSLAIFFYHGFLSSIPISIEEAAVVDGANFPNLFFRIVFPLLKPTTVTIIILNFMWVWNDYLLPYLTIGNQDVKTLTLELYFAKMSEGQYGNAWELIFPAVLVTIIPVVVLFMFFQKYFMQGIVSGAVKG